MNNKQFILTKESPALWRVTFNNPPVNIFGPKTIPQFNEIMTAIESNEQLKVPRLIGRGRAMEVFMGADDIPGDLAERLDMSTGPFRMRNSMPSSIHWQSGSHRSTSRRSATPSALSMWPVCHPTRKQERR
jgi:enoyl-CoA hydratase/carnithine racemase